MSVTVTLKAISSSNTELALYLNDKKVTASGLVLTDSEYANLSNEEFESLNSLMAKGYVEVTQNGVYLTKGNAGNMPMFTDIDARLDVLETV